MQKLRFSSPGNSSFRYAFCIRVYDGPSREEFVGKWIHESEHGEIVKFNIHFRFEIFPQMLSDRFDDFGESNSP
jgi:hypothetical protein